MSYYSEHLDYLKGKGYSPATLDSATMWLERFEKFCNGRDPSKLNTEALELWHRELVWKPGPSGRMYSKNTVNQAVGAIRRFYRWGLAAGKLKTDPTSTLFTPQVKPEEKPGLKLSEARRLLSSPDLDSPTGIRDRAILGLLLETKISKGACSRIDTRHLCFETNALLTKGRCQKIHSLSDGLLSDLVRYVSESRPLLLSVGTSPEALFLNQRGNRLTKNSVSQIWRNHRIRAGL